MNISRIDIPITKLLEEAELFTGGKGKRPATADRAARRDFDPNQPRDEHGRWSDTGGGDGSELPPKLAYPSVASDLYHANGGAGSKTAAQVIEETGTAKYVADAERKLRGGKATNLPVSEGGHVLPNGQ